MKRFMEYRRIARILAAVMLFLLAAPMAGGLAENAVSTVPELIAQFRQHTERAEDSFKLSITADILNGVLQGGDGLFAAILMNNGVNNIGYQYDMSGSIRSVTFNRIEYYPGRRVALAYRTGSTAGLSSRERQLLDAAGRFVATLSGSALEKERAIHDYLCDTVDYKTDYELSGFSENDSAIGAMLNGRADCDGYADAFAMLCEMAGLQAQRISGQCLTDGRWGEHMWNAVQINGAWCFVDVTGDDQDTRIEYFYFNRGAELFGKTYSWKQNALSINVVSATDNRFRSADLWEYAVGSWEELSAVLYDRALARAPHIRINAAPSMRMDSDRLFQTIYRSGATAASLSDQWNLYDIRVQEYYEHFRRVDTEQEAVSYLSECKSRGWSSFTLLCSESLYGSIKGSNGLLTHLLTRAGLQIRQYSYSDDACAFIFNNVQ